MEIHNSPRKPIYSTMCDYITPNKTLMCHRAFDAPNKTLMCHRAFDDGTLYTRLRTVVVHLIRIPSGDTLCRESLTQSIGTF